MKFTINEDIFSIFLKKQKTDYNNGVICKTYAICNCQCIIFAGFDLYRRDIMPAADFALGNEEINFHT